MLLTKKVFKTTFIEALKGNGLSVYFNGNDFYFLTNGDDSSRIVAVKLICSTKINKDVLGSHNNNTVDGIGHFLFTIPKSEEKINFFVFAFLNTIVREIEFVIVSNEVLRSRFLHQNRIPASGKKAEMTLWLMPDRCVYDTTNLSVEAEWYWLRKGTGGRMADGGEMDYTGFLNNWGGITDSL